MFQYDEEEPIVCYNCDAEFNVSRTDGSDEAVAFCPYCGYDMEEDEDYEDEDEDTLQ